MKSLPRAIQDDLDIAQEKWGPLGPDLLRSLRALIQEHQLSVKHGDVTLLSGGWYVTHTGLLRIARLRKRGGRDKFLAQWHPKRNRRGGNDFIGRHHEQRIRPVGDLAAGDHWGGCVRFLHGHFHTPVRRSGLRYLVFYEQCDELSSSTVLTGTGTAAAQHSVSLTWNSSANAVGYNIYRSSVSGGPYSIINTSLNASTRFTDNSVSAGQTYYYVTTAVDGSGNESGYSNEAQAVIPTP